MTGGEGGRSTGLAPLESGGGHERIEGWGGGPKVVERGPQGPPGGGALRTPEGTPPWETDGDMHSKR